MIGSYHPDGSQQKGEQPDHPDDCPEVIHSAPPIVDAATGPVYLQTGHTRRTMIEDSTFRSFAVPGKKRCGYPNSDR
jgi:hypothetical protein